MGLLTGKRVLIMGLANDNSLAWGISRAFHAEGAELCFTYVNEAIEKRVRPLAASLGCDFVIPCNVDSDTEIEQMADHLKARWGTFDIIIHAISYSKKEELSGEYLQVTRAGFQIAMNTSVYSLTAVIKATRPLLNSGGSVLTLTYHGSQQVAQHYNVMGVAKAALEASVRYLASDLGPANIRVNAISAGPIRTLAASGIAGFKDILKSFAGIAPLRRNVTQDDVGNTALFLCSHLAAATTGEIIYVDAGFRTVSIAVDA
jgi:enoyl-[acyl-carrier protein] reductase I